MDNIEKALAAYERTQTAFDTPFDRFMAGDQKAISVGAKRGWSLFNGKSRCMTCPRMEPDATPVHRQSFHNIGVSAHKSDFVPLARKALVLISQGGGLQRLDQLAIQSDMSGLGRFLLEWLLVFGRRFHLRDHIVKALIAHLDRIEDRTFDLLLQRGRAPSQNWSVLNSAFKTVGALRCRTRDETHRGRKLVGKALGGRMALIARHGAVGPETIVEEELAAKLDLRRGLRIIRRNYP